MKHLFDVGIATKYGVDVSIFIHHISYWVEFNKNEGTNFHDGKYWTYNKISSFPKHFPYWSHKQIERIINKCFDAGLLIKSNFNKAKYDRTCWYTLSDLSYNLLNSHISRNQEMEIPNSGNGVPEIGTPIPDNKPYNKQQIKDKRSCPTTVERPGFERFWSLYPRKENKKGALQIWTKRDLEARSEEIELHLMKRLEGEWKSKDKQYMPMPTTFLNGERWNDDLTTPSKTNVTPLKQPLSQHAKNINYVMEQLRNGN